jgi:hypothetical protein
MESREVLERAARYYDVLTLLSTKDYNCHSLEDALQKDYQSIKNYILKLKEAKLVEVKKHKKIGADRSKYTVSISELGKFAQNYINNFKTQIETPSLRDEITTKLEQIIPLIEGDFNEKTIKYHSDILYKFISDTNFQTLFSPLLRDFFERYISDMSSNHRICECLSNSIPEIMSNIELRKWFFSKIYPKIVEQFGTEETPVEIKLCRIELLWQIFNQDNDKKSEILKIFLSLLEQEDDPGAQLSRTIYTNNMTETSKIIQELIKLNVNKEIIENFVR